MSPKRLFANRWLTIAQSSFWSSSLMECVFLQSVGKKRIVNGLLIFEDGSVRTDLEQDLEHSRAAYIFALRSLPDPVKLQTGAIEANGFTFTKHSQIQSMVIELGWAFYCRYEACLEAFIKEQGISLGKKKTLENWMDENGVVIPYEYKDGFKVYRNVRNWLHHRDGQNEDGTEIHLYPEHMDQFYEFFVWIASAIFANREKECGH